MGYASLDFLGSARIELNHYKLYMGLIMFDPVSIGAASIGVNRVSKVSSPARVSDLSTRSRNSEDAAFSRGSANEAAGDRRRRDPVGLKAKAGDSRNGKRSRTDATEEEPLRPKVKFRAPSEIGDTEPIFEAEGKPTVKRSKPILDEPEPKVPRRNQDGTPDDLGRNVDVYA